MSGQVLRAFSWMLVDKFAELMSALIVGVALARHLGPDDFGMFSYVLAIAAMLAPFTSLGLNHLLTKELVVAPASEKQIMGTTAVLTVGSALLLTAATGIWAYSSASVHRDLARFVVLTVGARCLGAFDYLQFWFLAKNRSRTYSMTRAVVIAAFLALKLSLILAGASLEAFLLVSAAEIGATGIRSIVAYIFQRDLRVTWEWSFTTARNLLAKSWPTAVGGVTAAVYLKLDLILLGALSTAQQVGIYATASKLSEIWYVFPTLFMASMFPSILRLRETDRLAYERRIKDLVDVMAAAGTLVAIFTCLLASWIVPLVFGYQYLEAVPILVIHVWAGVFIFMRAVLSKWILAEGLYMLSLTTQVCGAVVNVLLNLYLIPRFGGIGAAVSTIVSYSVASCFALLLSASTRPFFGYMMGGLLWPRRIPEATRFVNKQLRERLARNRQ